MFRTPTEKDTEYKTKTYGAPSPYPQNETIEKILTFLGLLLTKMLVSTDIANESVKRMATSFKLQKSY
jgi:hypothetical protein